MANSLGIALVAAGIGLVIGVGIGFVLGVTPEPDAADTAESVGEQPSSTSGEAASAPEETRGPKTARTRTTEHGSHAGVSGSLAAVLDEFPQREPIRGSGTLTGTVKTREGEPIADAEITATAHMPKGWRPQGWNLWDDDAPLEEKIRNFVRDERWKQASKLTATTGVDGSFELTELGAGPFRLRATADGYNISSAWKAKLGDRVELVAHPYVEFELAILLPSGESAMEASVRLADPETGGGGAAWTAKDPKVRWTPGRYQLIAVSLDERLSSAPFDLDLKAGAPPAPITVRLAERPGVGGKVISPPGRAETWVQVYIARIAGEAIPPEQLIRQSGKQVSTGPYTDWKYSYTDLALGRYLLGVSVDHGKHFLHTDTVEIGAAYLQHDLEIPAPRRADHIVVQVTGPQGEPATIQEHVTLYFQSEKQSGSRSSKAVARGDGKYWVRQLPEEARTADSTHGVAVFHPSYGWAESSFVPGPSAAATIRFAAPAIPTITVQGIEGSAARGFLSVGLAPPTGQGRPSRPSGTNVDPGVDGKARLAPTAPGEYDLCLYCRHTRGSTYMVARNRVSLTSGEQEFGIAIPPLHTLTVLAPEGGRVRKVTLYRAKQGQLRMPAIELEPDSSGRAVFQRLPAGEYSVLPGVIGIKSKKVTIPGETVLRF